MSEARLPSYREVVTLPVGFETRNGVVYTEAEVRPVSAGDELFIGMSPEYARHPNDLVYKTLLLSRTVTRIGEHKPVTMSDIQKLHAKDARVLEYAVYRITYGEESLPPEDPNTPGG